MGNQHDMNHLAHRGRRWRPLAGMLALPPVGYVVVIVLLHMVLLATTVAAVSSHLNAARHYTIVVGAGIALAGSYALCALALVRTRRGRLGETSTSVALMTLALAFCLSMMEAAFAVVPRSHAVGHGLAAALWFKTYWKPINSLGYRDREHDLAGLDGTRRIVVVGDSFVAGHGLGSVADRFSDALQQELGAGNTVFNLGVNGIDTREEYRRLVSFPVQPDVVVLSYFGNDVVEAAEAAGRRMRPDSAWAYGGLGRLPRLVLTHSYLLNYIYWQFPHAVEFPYYEFLSGSYRDPRTRAIHREDLRQFVHYSRARDIDLVVVLFPYLQDLEGSAVYTSFVEELFAQEGIPVIEVSKLVSDLALPERIVNRNDAHASALVNRRVADALHRHVARPAP